MDINDLFAKAEENTKSLETTGTKQRDERLIDIRTPKGVTRTIYFRMFIDATQEKPVTYLPYKEYSFKSLKTDKNIYAGVSPEAFGGEDYFKKRQYEIYDDNKEAGKRMYPSEKRLVNLLVISDSYTPENNGQPMVMRYGAKPVDTKRARSGSPMMKCFHNLLIDEDKKDPSVREIDLYSLSKDGITLKMTIQGDDNIPDIEVISLHAKKGQKIEGFVGMNEKQQREFYTEKAVNLIELVGTPRSDEDLEKIIRTHLLCDESPDVNNEPNKGASYFGGEDEEDENDDLPDFQAPASKTKEKSADSADSGSDELDGLLNDMEI